MRPVLTLNSLGWVYLWHFSRPLGNLSNARAQAQHYIGYADDPDGDAMELERRAVEHLAGRGAHITRAAVAQGIEITLVATWRATLGFEKYLKRRKEAPRLCPICCRARGQKVKQVEPVKQLTLDLDDQAEDWIEPWADEPAPSTKMDNYEFFYYRHRLAWNEPLPIDVPDELI
jgi:hypothetical protein